MKFHPVTLQFRGDLSHLEKSFLVYYLKNSLAPLRIALILGGLFFAVFGVLDAVLIPEKRYLTWAIRYLIICPAILFVFSLTFIKNLQKWLQLILTALIVVSGAGIVAMIIVAPPPVSYSYYAGLILIFMFGYTLLRVRFVFATVAGWIIVVLYEVAAVHYQTPVPVLINNNFFFVGANITGMIASYYIEFFSRRAFYLNWLLTKEKEKVNAANLELEKRVKKRTEQLENTNKQLTREIIERKQSEDINQTLFSISNALNVTLDINDLYRQIHRSLAKSIDVTNFFIAIVNEKERTLYFPYYVDTTDDDFAPITDFDPTKSLTGFVVSNRKPLLLKKDKLKELADQDGVWGPVPVIWMGVPLIVKHEIIGVVVVQSYTDPELYNEQDLEILVSISAQMAVAIDRKRTEDELRASEKKFRTLFKTSPNVITLSSYQDGKYVDVNDSYTRLLGYTQDDAIGKTSVDLNIWKTPKDLDLLVSGLKEKGIVQNQQTTFQGKDGQIIVGLMSARLVEMGDKLVVLAVTQDTTELKKNEQKRLDLEIRLQQAQKMEAIGTLAGGIAHDFNNILFGILGYSELALDAVDNPDEVRDCITQIEKGSKRAADIVKQILTFSRQTDYEKRPILLHNSIEEVLKLMRPSIPPSIDLKQVINSQARILADPTKIHQLLINLYTNAYHAIGENSGEIVISLSQKKIKAPDRQLEFALPSGEYLEMELSDTGTGMDKAVIDKIFDPYFTTKQTGSGTGLGMALVQAIVKEHDGYIHVTSIPEKGTRFIVYFPIFRGTDHLVPTAAEKDVHLRGNETIMVVDDEPAVRKVTKRFLEKHGYVVTVFDNGLDAFTEFERNPQGYDLIITDLTMPKMSGDQLAQRISKKRPDISVLMCTGFTESISQETADEIGIHKILSKPLTMGDLLKNVRETLDAQ